MQFYEEDDVLNATSALIRSSSRVEDSTVREFIREVMGKIKYSSGYGYTEATIYPRPRPFEKEGIAILTGLGYWVIEKLTDNWNKTSREHVMHILWKEPSAEEMLLWNGYGTVYLPNKTLNIVNNASSESENKP